MDKKTIGVSTLITIIAVSVVGFGLSQQISGIGNKIGVLYDSNDLTKIVDNISKSVVQIRVPFSPSQSGQASADYVDNHGNAWSVGAGFVIRDDGYIMTAKHVVDGASNVFVILENGTILQAAFGTSDELLDVAIVKVNTKLPAVELGNFNSIHVGTKIVFMGYPLFEPTQITHSGIVSFTGAIGGLPAFSINSIVNHGNSGGPVFLEESGQVIGIINARQVLTNVNQINIPSNISFETQLILQSQNQLINAFNENSQSGIGIATPVDKSILDLLPPK